MISIIITAFKEPKTIGKAIESVLKQKLINSEVIVVAPDDETINEALKFKRKNKNVITLKDSGEGKPEALNLAVRKAKGEILILTDGDVYVGEDSLKILIAQLSDDKIGAVSGRPISINDKDNMLGYWSHVLADTANDIRKESVKEGRSFFCSGYLFAIRKKIFPKLNKDLLSEDGYISNEIYNKGYRIGYSEFSKVYVKYPNNFSDWIKQKKRSAGGYNQIKKITGVEMRSFKKESLGAFKLFKYVKSFKEAVWLFSLFLARIYLWILIYRDINIKRKSQKEIWQRVESTK